MNRIHDFLQFLISNIKLVRSNLIRVSPVVAGQAFYTIALLGTLLSIRELDILTSYLPVRHALEMERSIVKFHNLNRVAKLVRAERWKERLDQQQNTLRLDFLTLVRRGDF